MMMPTLPFPLPPNPGMFIGNSAGGAVADATC